MVQRLIGQYFARARTVAQTIGIDAYFIDERSGHVVRLEPNGNFSFLRSFDDGQDRISAGLNVTEKPDRHSMPAHPGPNSMNGQRKPFVVEVKRARQLAWKERKLLSGPASIRRVPWQSAEVRQGTSPYQPMHSRMSLAGKRDADR